MSARRGPGERPARRSQTASPRIADVVLSHLVDADAEHIVARGAYEASRYERADLSGRDLTGVAFTECEFDGLEAHETQLLGARVIESRIQRANAPVLRAGRTTWREVRISNSRFGAVEMFDSDLESVHISESKLSFVNLRASRLRDVQFEQCVIGELDLAEARAERIAFTGCSVRSLRLDHAQLRDVDLRELDLSSVSGVESMRGTIISFTQAVDLTSAFAQHLGITIAD